MDKQINVKVDISIKSTNINNSTTLPYIISDDTVPVPICLIISNNVTQTCEIASQLLKDGRVGHFIYATTVHDVVQHFAKFERVDKIFFDMRLERENMRIFTWAHSKMMLSNPKGLVIPIWKK